MQAKYRADIDGLRAVAILLVIAYHTSSYRAPGGFIGVDIFFVISGFLISGIIFSQLDKRSFSYADFYAHRIKRIFPALLLVLTTAWLLGYALLFMNEFEQLGQHIASGIAFVANITLWNESGYFDNASEGKPLLHLWSLGVEEQFYILYPLLVTALWRFKTYFIWVIGIIFLISFSANIYLVDAQQIESAFYLPIPRFWELMVGSLLAYYSLYKVNYKFLPKVNPDFLSGLGLLLIVLGFLFIDREASFPGWWALLPVLGSACLLSAQTSWVNQSFLGSKPMVFIGLISYPLYLWHWLLLSFAYITKLDSGSERMVAVAISFVLAWLTYVLLEKNIRYRKGFVIPSLMMIAIFLFVLGLATLAGKIAPKHDSRTIRMAIEATKDWTYPQGLDEINIQGQGVFIKNGNTQKVLFFGDSHIEQYAPRIIKLIEDDPEHSSTAIFATHGACPPILGLFRAHQQLCTSDYRQAMLAYGLSPEISSVVIGARWELYLIKNNPYQETLSHFYMNKNGEKKYLSKDGVGEAKAVLETILYEIAQKKTVYLVLDNPDIKSLSPKDFLDTQRFSENLGKLETHILYSDDQVQLHHEMIQIARRAGAKIIDPTAHFCSDLLCKAASSDGTLIYKDTNHIRASYVREHIDYIDKTVRIQ